MPMSQTPTSVTVFTFLCKAVVLEQTLMCPEAYQLTATLQHSAGAREVVRIAQLPNESQIGQSEPPDVSSSFEKHMYRVKKTSDLLCALMNILTSNHLHHFVMSAVCPLCVYIFCSVLKKDTELQLLHCNSQADF